MKKLWVGTNWKMTKTTEEGIQYFNELNELTKKIDDRIQLFFIPSFTSLYPIEKLTRNTRFNIGAQNMHWEERGAFTGEVSVLHLKEIQVDLVELGHSERRQYFNENDEQLNLKVKLALKHGIKPLLCIGENIIQKNNNETELVLRRQLSIALQDIPKEQLQHVLVAYEPIWAIGEEGIEAAPHYVHETHKLIKLIMQQQFGIEMPLLFGGSVNVGNFKEYLNCHAVDGLFIGRAAWDLRSFAIILNDIQEMLSNDKN